MVTSAWGESHHAGLENEDVQLCGHRYQGGWRYRAGIFFFVVRLRTRDQGLERDEVVVAKHLDLLSRFPDDDILRRQRMDREILRYHVDIIFGAIAEIHPPDVFWIFPFQVIQDAFPGRRRGGLLRPAREIGETGESRVHLVPDSGLFFKYRGASSTGVKQG
jgi:hypothetical protein